MAISIDFGVKVLKLNIFFFFLTHCSLCIIYALKTHCVIMLTVRINYENIILYNVGTLLCVFMFVLRVFMGRIYMGHFHSQEISKNYFTAVYIIFCG